MKIDENWLVKNNACNDWIKWFSSQKETDAVAVVRSLLREKKLDWANSIIVRILDRKHKIKYAVFSAEQVIHIFEKEHPDDERPRDAIRAVLAVVENYTKEDKVEAIDSALAASWAADSSDGAAAWAAVSASRAAESALFGEESSYRSAMASESSAKAASWAYGPSMKKIIEYGISLLEKNP